MDALITALLHNQFLSGGIGIAAFGALLALCRKLPGELWWRVRSQCVVRVEVLGTDPVFEWVRVWLARHEYTRRSRLLTASSASNESGADSTSAAIFTPAPGFHFLRYANHLVWINFTREGVESSFTISREAVQISILGRDPRAARDLIEEARRAYLERNDGCIGVFRSVWDRWIEAGRIRPRALASVILDDDTALSRVSDDMRRFAQAGQWYREHDIPWRRGYLFEGVPGSGKSSAIVALAGEHRRNVYLLSLSGRGMSNDRLTDLLVQVPENAVVVLEDVDAAFQHRAATDEYEGSVTFSGLLNAIDGIGAREGRILFMTTNHPEHLDPALVRAGRVDMRLRFDYATPQQAMALYRRFHANGSGDTAAAFLLRLKPRDTMADVQGWLLDSIGGETDAT